MKVLQVVNALDYGGVETYAIRLSRAMMEQGHEVSILTHGGVLEQLAEEVGLEVIRLRPGPSGLSEAIASLRGRTFDILNAHNYNSGRIGCAVARELDLPYVLTVHGPRPFLKRLLYPCWSRTVITMSEGDRREITGWGGRPATSVVTTFVPIDTHRYRLVPAPEPSKLIVHVSRFSHRKTRVAMSLLDAAPEIVRREPNARILIVGAGSEFHRVEARVSDVAARLGSAVRIEQARSDLAPTFASASVVIATAATAMEALACGAPVIAAGRTGYLGPMTSDRFQEGVDLMFADHGRCPRPVLPESLCSDVLRVLADPVRWRSESASMAATIADRFTPARAAEHVISVYERVLSGGQP